MPNLRSYSCRAKSTYATHCFVQFLNLGEAGALDGCGDDLRYAVAAFDGERFVSMIRSEEHTSELQSLMRISYAVFCLKKKTTISTPTRTLHDLSLLH